MVGNIMIFIAEQPSLDNRTGHWTLKADIEVEEEDTVVQ